METAQGMAIASRGSPFAIAQDIDKDFHDPKPWVPLWLYVRVST